MSGIIQYQAPYFIQPNAVIPRAHSNTISDYLPNMHNFLF